MIGGLIARPVECSTGPGQADADRGQLGRRRGRCAAEQLARSCVLDPAEHDLGPGRDVEVRAPLGEDRAGEVGERGRACVAPMSTPATTRALGLSASSDGGRPPVETPSPNGATRPSRISTSIRAAIVERARPVASASWARVRGCPSRSSSKTSLVRTAEVNHARLLHVQQTTFAETLDKSA